MSTTNCNCNIGCIGRSVIASIIVGVVTAALRYTAAITVTPAFLWVLFGIAIGFLGITLLTSSTTCDQEANCCWFLRPFLTGIFGTLLFSVILLGISFAATSIIGALVTGLLLFFFTLLVTSSACLITCRHNCN